MHDEEFDIGWSNRAGKDILKIKDWRIKNISETVADKVVHRLYNAVEPTRTQPEHYPWEPRLKNPFHQSLELQNHLRIYWPPNHCA